MKAHPLFKWLQQYVTFRASQLQTTFEEIADPAQGYILKNTEGKTIEYYFLDHVTSSFFKSVEQLIEKEKPKRIALIQMNARSEVLQIVPLWGQACKIEDLSIIFVDVVSGNKWILKPYLHNKICDPNHLEKSLLALMDSLKE